MWQGDSLGREFGCKIDMHAGNLALCDECVKNGLNSSACEHPETVSLKYFRACQLFNQCGDLLIAMPAFAYQSVNLIVATVSESVCHTILLRPEHRLEQL